MIYPASVRSHHPDQGLHIGLNETRRPAQARSSGAAAPQGVGGQAGPFRGGGELHPDDVLGHVLTAGEGAKAAVGAGNHAFAVPDHGRGLLQAAGDDAGDARRSWWWCRARPG